MLAILAEAALRSFMLGSVVWLGLKLLRVRNPHVQMTSWVLVLVASLAMPLLMQWTEVTITVPAAPSVAAQDSLPGAESLLAEAPRGPLSTGLAPHGAADGTSHHAVDWWTVAVAVYGSVAALLLMRLALGCLLTWRLVRAATPIRSPWAKGSDVRECREIGGPVTFGSVILLPPEQADWDLAKRQAVLAHERAHVASRDFYLLLLASLNRALFWFSPFAWWQLRRLAELAEIIADARAIEVLEDRMSYAELLLELVQNVRPRPLGLEMARACTVPERVDRILAAVGLPAEVGWRKRFQIAAALLPLAIASSGSVSYRLERAPLSAAADEALLTIVPKPEIADFYSFGARSVFAVFQDGDDRFAQVTGQRRVRLAAESDGTYAYPAAGGEITFARNAERPGEMVLHQNGHDLKAVRIAGLGQSATATTGAFAQYAGWYELSPYRAVTIVRAGAGMRVQETGRAPFDAVADGADTFAGAHGDLVIFLRSGQGDIDRVLLSDPISGPRLARRIDAARGKAIEDELDRRTVEASERFRDQAPAPGSKEAILHGIEAMQRGTPDYARMGEALAAAIRRQADQLHATFVALGAVETIFFRGVGPGGYDIYGVKFANGSAEFRLLLGPDGKVNDVLFRPDGDGQPGGVANCPAETTLKATADGAPIRIFFYNDTGSEIQVSPLDAAGKRMAQTRIGDSMSAGVTTSVNTPVVVSDRSGQCLEIVLAGQQRRFNLVETSASGSARERGPRATPLAGSEEKLRQYIAGVSLGRPDYDHMTSEVATLTRQQLPFNQAILAKLGALRAISFRGVTQMGNDIYMAHFANGTAEWRIGLAKDGTIARIALGPQS
ncbi:M56 family metallopeptidase [Bradyrhizobium sp.]|uniref:M56 family metallopeptidase n=1 Tax=Bradyrhizobium sp. TaxID=376 RepID=UPI001ED631CE|nr:M56 family metallopeptidase [Bradyrhizobium sp.]MBV9979330.1 M56 family metallopeptidase [Bradyrhizobium sp.]